MLLYTFLLVEIICIIAAIIMPAITSDQAALVSIRTWTYMLQQRHGHGPDQIIKQDHPHFNTLIHSSANIEYLNNSSLSLYFIYDFVSRSVLQ